MTIHKRTRLTLLDYQEIWRLYQTWLWKVTHLAERFRVNRSTIYDVLKCARLQEFTPRAVRINGSRRCGTVSNAKLIAITKLIRVGRFISIPNDPSSSKGNPSMNFANICLRLSYRSEVYPCQSTAN